MHKQNELLRDETLINKQEALEWRGKWERDGGRCSTLQREYEHALHAREEQLAQLQGQHRLELQQRDNVLRRCKDTIMALEAMIASVLHGLVWDTSYDCCLTDCKHCILCMTTCNSSAKSQVNVATRTSSKCIQ